MQDVAVGVTAAQVVPTRISSINKREPATGGIVLLEQTECRKRGLYHRRPSWWWQGAGTLPSPTPNEPGSNQRQAHRRWLWRD